MKVDEPLLAKRRTGAETRRLVIDAARRRIESDGAVSLKISDIVRETGIADVIIYRHFADRRGVIVEALAEIWLEFTRANLGEARRIIDETPGRGVTASMLAGLMIPPRSEVFRRRRWLRVQTLSAAQEFPELRDRISTEQALANQELEEILEAIRVKNCMDPFVVPVETIRANIIGSTLGLVLDDVAGASLSDEAQRRHWEWYFVAVGLAVPG